jgi:PAS domain S-box-containing protein
MSQDPGDRDAVDYLEGLLEGFVAYDAQWRMVYMNAAGERILGRRRDDVLGKTWHAAFPHAVGNEVDRMYQRVMSSRVGETMEYYYAHYGRWMEISAAPVRTGGVGVYFRDISDRKRAEQALHESEARFRTLADRAPVMIWVNSLEGCAYVNRTYLDYLGVGDVDVRAYDWARFVHEEDRDAYLDAYLKAVAARASFEAQFRFRRHDGEYRFMRSVGTPRYSPAGELLGYVGVTVDINDMKAAEEQLRLADKRKDEFLATLAHELRNPLAPLRSGLQVLRVAPPGSNAIAEAQDMMERHTAHLVRLLDDLMEMSRVTQGRLTMQKKVTDLGEIVRTAIELSRPLVAAGSHQLEVDLPPEPIRVLADPVRLAQVVANLLDNAAKYTLDGGHIRLTVRRVKGRAAIRVQDNGIGIAPEMLPRVFDRFAQVPSALKRSHGGLGIGLSLARTLVELHGGTIEAKSDGEGKGAEFVVSLPALAAHPAAGDAP